MVDLKNKRTLIFLGHSGSGKTSCIDSMLFKAGINSRHGSVDQGTSMCDYNNDEIQRKTTMRSKVFFIQRGTGLSYIIDTPGYADFSGSLLTSLRVVDSGVCVVCAVNGVETGTERCWDMLKEKNLPRVLFINKLDKENSDFDKALSSIREAFGNACIALQFPVGKEASFSRVISLFDKAEIEKLQGPEKESAMKYRESLFESVAETDDMLLEKYISGEMPTDDEIRQALKKAVCQGKLFPVLCGCALKDIGIPELIDCIEDLLPSPLDAGPVFAGQETMPEAVKVVPDAQGDFSAFVFRSLIDPFIGQLTVFRVFSGTLKSDTSFYNVTKSVKERIGQIFMLQGKEQKVVSEVSCGDIAAVAKLKETGLGDTIASEGVKFKFEPVILPEPAISLSVKPVSRHDEEKIMTALSKLNSEDPTFKFSRDQQTKELIVSGLGDMHLTAMVGKLKNDFKVDVELGVPKVAYKETVKKKVQIQGKYKKQSGGRGQYGDVWLEIEPLPRGGNFEFLNKVVGGVVPRQYIPAVEKGVIQAMEEGAIAGYPLVDIRVTIYDGSYHSVDSSEMAFKIAGSMALKKGVHEANPVLLEPIMNVSITAPGDAMGSVTGDINSKRGRIIGVEAKGHNEIVMAKIPLSEMLKYATELRSLTAGRGSYHMEFSHYDETPAKIAQGIIAKYQQAKQNEKEE
ncbi:MAG: elongation factor G [Candidatus Omnitrophica bacterium]|nr:elongation factor G [Candidatus Omnitrophota bacterium]